MSGRPADMARCRCRLPFAEVRMFGPKDWLLKITWPNGSIRMIGATRLFGTVDAHVKRSQA